MPVSARSIPVERSFHCSRVEVRLFCFFCSLFDDVQCLAGDGCRHPTGGFNLRGPRPPSENWPRRSAPPTRPPIEARTRAGRWRQPPGGRVSVPPEVAAQAARKRVEGTEAALGALAAVGTVDGPEVQMLKECFAKAKRSAQERPLAQQISHTESHLERAKKRLIAQMQPASSL